MTDKLFDFIDEISSKKIEDSIIFLEANQLEKKSLNKKISIKQKSDFIISSLLNLIKSNKINLKKKGVYIDKKNIFNYMKKTFSNKKSNNPIKLNNKDLKIIINRMLKIWKY